MSALGPDRIVAGRVVVDRSEARCIDCAQPFKFGVNVFTRDGLKEVGISGVCEKCFDALFDDDDADGEEPYCGCDNQPTEDELARNRCASCGKEICP